MSGNNNEAFEKWYDSVREYKCSEKELLIMLWNHLTEKHAKEVRERVESAEGALIEMIEHHCHEGREHPYNTKLNGVYYMDAGLSANETAFKHIEKYGSKE